MRRVGFPLLRPALRAELRQIAPAPYPVIQKGPFSSKSLVYNPLCFQSRNQGLQRLYFLSLSLSEIFKK